MNTLIGQKIKTLRKQKGLSQEQVADSLHISNQLMPESNVVKAVIRQVI